MKSFRAVFAFALLGPFLWSGSAQSQQKLNCSFERKPPKDSSKAVSDIIPQTPLVRVGATAHGGTVNSISVASAAPIVATASGDKSIRLWDPTRALSPIKTLYAPAGFEAVGEPTAISLSPDGKLLAVTGNFEFDIKTFYIFNTETGQVADCFTGESFPEVVHFRPSGELLVSLSRHLMSLDVSTQPAKFKKVASLDADIVAIGESTKGLVAVLDKANQLRTFSADWKQLALKKFAGKGRAASVSFSPSGNLLAVGFEGEPRAELLSISNLATALHVNLPKDQYAETKLVRILDQGIAVSFARPKSSGKAASSKNYGVALVSDSGLGSLEEIIETADAVTALEAIGGEGLVVGTGDGRLAHLQRGKLVRDLPVTKLDFRHLAADKSFGVGREGRILFRPEPKGSLMMADFASSVFTSPANDSAEKPRYPLDGATEAEVSGWRVSQAPKIFGKPLPMREGERTLSAAMAPNKVVALGTDFRIRLIAPSGKELRGSESDAAVWAVGFSPDGRRLIAAMGNGCFNYYDVDDTGIGRKVATAYIEADGQTWVAWTPDGFFDHSQGRAKELVGYLLNGTDRDIAPTYLSFAQLYKLLYAPDLVRKLIAGGSEKAIAEAAERKKQLGDVRKLYEAALPPAAAVTRICYNIGEEICPSIGRREKTPSLQLATRGLATQASVPADSNEAKEATEPPADTIAIEIPLGIKSVKVTFSADIKDGGVGLSRFYLDGINKQEERIDGKNPGSQITIDKEVDVTSGDVEVQLRIYDKTNTVYGNTPKIRLYNSTANQVRLGRLFVIVAGIDEYGKEFNAKTMRNGELHWLCRGACYDNLDSAVSDARQFSKGIDASTAQMFTSVEKVELYNADAKTDRIIAEIGKIASKATPADTVLVYLAGHGQDFHLNPGQAASARDYFYLSANAALTDSQRSELAQYAGDGLGKFKSLLAANALTGRVLFKDLSKINTGKVMVFLDTCHGGSTQFAEALGQRSDETGLFILAAAGSDEFALDQAAGGTSGPFARALKNVLEGAAQSPSKYLSQLQVGRHVVSFMNVYVKETDANHKQTARFISGGSVKEWPIAFNPRASNK